MTRSCSPSTSVFTCITGNFPGLGEGKGCICKGDRCNGRGSLDSDNNGDNTFHVEPTGGSSFTRIGDRRTTTKSSDAGSVRSSALVFLVISAVFAFN